MTVTTVPVTLLSRVRASSAVPWNASGASGEPGLTSMWDTANPTSSATRALTPGSTHSEPVAYSRIASRLIIGAPTVARFAARGSAVVAGSGSRAARPSKTRPRSASGSARARTSSPARSLVWPRTWTRRPWRLTMLIQACSPMSRSAMAVPSAADPGATTSPAQPVGFVAEPHAQGPRLGFDDPHRHPEHPGDGRGEAALHHDRDQHDDEDDAVDPGRVARPRRRR